MNVQPEDINTDQHFWDAFGHVETEISAMWIVRFCQERGQSWKPFTYQDIEQFYNNGGHKDFRFNRLLSQGYIQEQDGCSIITPAFVERCYRSSLR